MAGRPPALTNGPASEASSDANSPSSLVTFTCETELHLGFGRGRQAGGLDVRFAWRRFNAGLLHEVPAVEGTEPRIVLVSDMSNAHASRLALFVTGAVWSARRRLLAMMMMTRESWCGHEVACKAGRCVVSKSETSELCTK